MSTLLQAIAYLWGVLTILLIVMFFLREQDRRRKDERRNELEEDLLAAPRSEAATATPETTEISTADVDAAETGAADAADGGDAPVDDTPEEAVRPEERAKKKQDQTEDAVQPLPWGKTGQTKRKKKRNRPKTGSKTTTRPNSTNPTTADQDETAEAQTAEGATADSAENKGDNPGSATEQASGIFDILQGVTLPFDLTPLTTSIEDPDRHAVFISRHPDAAEVGTAFADELVGLGFDIEAAGFDQALATRDGDTISMRISQDAGTVADGSTLRYPTANENDVAIEVWIGNGSPPPMAN